jgi:hypothetical protein
MRDRHVLHITIYRSRLSNLSHHHLAIDLQTSGIEGKRAQDQDGMRNQPTPPNSRHRGKTRPGWNAQPTPPSQQAITSALEGDMPAGAVDEAAPMLPISFWRLRTCDSSHSLELAVCSSCLASEVICATDSFHSQTHTPVIHFDA